ncbi:hypothetical protein M5E06_20980 [Azospirillum sp. A1-3]|uniref:hypothetical protein n=1 Tax=Azospirillum sp. A1-3 TaxID=185874 RepID=UPI00207737D1|nr:hypothetical protein [Azospirillum sp. A1-3]MCM8736605.1 hypothetical protein [Azospirillum sp. A1-3]
MQTQQSKPLSQAIAEAADLIDCVAQREAYRRATEMIGPGLERITGRMPVGAMDGWTLDASMRA